MRLLSMLRALLAHYVVLMPALVSGQITVIGSDMAIDANTTWSGTIHLNAQVFVKAGATLTIEKGTEILAYYTRAGAPDSMIDEPHSATVDHAALLMIERGAMIMAEGTEDEPITFRSREVNLTVGDSQAGTWGGLIILGNAPTNGCDEETMASGAPMVEGINNTLADATYGGSNGLDNSGVLMYVRIWCRAPAWLLRVRWHLVRGGCDFSAGEDMMIQISDGAVGVYVNHVLAQSPKAGSLTDTDMTPETGTWQEGKQFFLQYYAYQVEDTSLPGATVINTWDDQCMPDQCTANPAADFSGTDVTIGPGSLDISGLDFEVVSVQGFDAANYPGAFSLGTSTWLHGWSLLDSYGKLGNTTDCQNPSLDVREASFSRPTASVAVPTVLSAFVALAAWVF